MWTLQQDAKMKSTQHSPASLFERHLSSLWGGLYLDLGPPMLLAMGNIWDTFSLQLLLKQWACGIHREELSGMRQTLLCLRCVWLQAGKQSTLPLLPGHVHRQGEGQNDTFSQRLWPVGLESCHKWVKENRLSNFIREYRNLGQFGSEEGKLFSFL